MGYAYVFKQWILDRTRFEMLDYELVEVGV